MISLENYILTGFPLLHTHIKVASSMFSCAQVWHERRRVGKRKRREKKKRRRDPACCCCIFFEWPLLLRASLIRSQVQCREGSAHASLHPNALFAFASTTITTTKRRQQDRGARGRWVDGWLHAIWLTGGHALLTAQQGAKHQVPPNCPTKQQQPQAARQGRSTPKGVGVQWEVLGGSV